MKIEHIGVLVKAPVSMGNWYSEHLKLEILRQLGTDEDGVTFLKDTESGTVLEFARLPEIRVTDFSAFDPLQLHIAIECDDPIGMSEALEQVGAVVVGESARAEGANERMLVKDPWGITIQLINRMNKL